MFLGSMGAGKTESAQPPLWSVAPHVRTARTRAQTQAPLQRPRNQPRLDMGGYLCVRCEPYPIFCANVGN